ncbi:hypothetical protein MRB53_036311 [Persea americana]|nr:hypothetical protein MRB53_039268 [Persea americana]KAJ8613961.1 hypothetical protein MRB53_036752 [Persea americana]KAJ8614179.1 hypothetical protein MRB53_036655 [Persea americana]KAJ8614898.1 hypothetical protein MRB53_036311 [Persea americana]
MMSMKRSMETEQGCGEVGNVTQSGRCYKPAHLRSDNPGNEQESQNPTPPATQPARRPEYEVANQLKRTQAQISIWELLMTSPALQHRGRKHSSNDSSQ